MPELDHQQQHCEHFEPCKSTYIWYRRNMHTQTLNALVETHPYLGSCSITISHQVSKGITQSHYNILSPRILLEQLDKYLEAIFIINYGCAAVIMG